MPVAHRIVTQVLILIAAMAPCFAGKHEDEMAKLSPSEYCKKAEYHIDDMQTAIRKCSEAIKQGGSNEELWTLHYQRGTFFVARSEFAQALADYNESNNLGNESIGFFWARASLNFTMDMPDQGFDDFRRGIAVADSWKRDPDFPITGIHRDIAARIYASRGLAHFRENEPKAAERDFVTALSWDRANPDVFAKRCEGRIYAKQLEKAFADCNKSLGSDRHGKAMSIEKIATEALNARGSIYLIRKKWSLAKADFQRSLDEGDPSNSVEKYGLGYAKLKLGDASGAEDQAAALKQDRNVEKFFRKMGIDPI